MIYDFKNEFDTKRADMRYEKLKREGKVVEITEIKNKRSDDQNALFHTWIAVFANFTGELDFNNCKKDVKRHLLGMKERYSQITGKIEYDDYETSKMTEPEMSDFMSKFKEFAGAYGCYLPYWKDAGYEEMMQQYSRFKRF